MCVFAYVWYYVYVYVYVHIYFAKIWQGKQMKNAVNEQTLDSE